MKLHALILAVGGLVGAAAVAQAQTPPQPGSLEAAQDVFGKVVGEAFHRPDPVVNAPEAVAPDAPGPALGRALRTSQEVPGAVFAGILKPFADADAAANPPPPPAAAPAPRHRRHAKVHRHRAPAQG